MLEETYTGCLPKYTCLPAQSCITLIVNKKFICDLSVAINSILTCKKAFYFYFLFLLFLLHAVFGKHDVYEGHTSFEWSPNNAIYRILKRKYTARTHIDHSGILYFLLQIISTTFGRTEKQYPN